MVISLALLKQVFIFGCVGVLATCVHYLIALFLSEVAGINLYLANFAGYASAVLVSLYGHSLFTYKKALNATVVRRFSLVSFGTMVASQGMLYVLEVAFALPSQISLAFVVLAIPVITFVLNKFWVYATPEQDSINQ